MERQSVNHDLELWLSKLPFSVDEQYAYSPQLRKESANEQ